MTQLDPKAVWLFFVRFMLFSLPLFVPLFFFGVLASLGIKDDDGDTIPSIFSFSWVLIPILIILCYVWARLTNYYYRYELTDAGFRKELGVIYKRYVTIPYDRIQNVDIYRGIWARILGLSDIHIQTAGMSASVSRYGTSGVGTEGRLPAISKDEAERIRDELIRRARTSRNQGL